MANEPTPAISAEAYRYVQQYSDATGTPVNQVISEALLFWWAAYGALILRTEADKAAYFDEHPGATDEDYRRWLRVWLSPD